MEREFLGRRKLVGREPADFTDVVRGLRLSGDDARRPVEVQRRRRVRLRPVAVDPDSDELFGLDLEARLLADLPADRVERVLALLEEPAGEIPVALERLAGAAREEDPAPAVDAERARGRL